MSLISFSHLLGLPVLVVVCLSHLLSSNAELCAMSVTEVLLCANSTLAFGCCFSRALKMLSVFTECLCVNVCLAVKMYPRLCDSAESARQVTVVLRRCSVLNCLPVLNHHPAQVWCS